MAYTWLLIDAPATVSHDCWLFSADGERGQDHSRAATIQTMDFVNEQPPTPTSSADHVALTQVASFSGGGSAQYASIQRTFSTVSSWVRDLDDPFNTWVSPSDERSLETRGGSPGAISTQGASLLLPRTAAPVPPVIVSLPSSETTDDDLDSSGGQELAPHNGSGQIQICRTIHSSPSLSVGQTCPRVDDYSSADSVAISHKTAHRRGCDGFTGGRLGADGDTSHEDDVEMVNPSPLAQTAMTAPAAPVGEANNHQFPQKMLSTDLFNPNTVPEQETYLPQAELHSNQEREVSLTALFHSQPSAAINDLGFESSRVTQPSAVTKMNIPEAPPPCHGLENAPNTDTTFAIPRSIVGRQGSIEVEANGARTRRGTGVFAPKGNGGNARRPAGRGRAPRPKPNGRRK
ncbi:hypothetical protein C8T65DRAFT_700348 [Cerioporus squamosus]|nr:hypothetical protein C8T65DRAFT_700348 [Cerioporus squamosus]